MNEQVYDAARQLSAADLAKYRGGFFNSILGILNHLIVGDIIWLKMFATFPTSYCFLQAILESDFSFF